MRFYTSMKINYVIAILRMGRVLKSLARLWTLKKASSYRTRAVCIFARLVRRYSGCVSQRGMIPLENNRSVYGLQV